MEDIFGSKRGKVFRRRFKKRSKPKRIWSRCRIDKRFNCARTSQPCNRTDKTKFLRNKIEKTIEEEIN
jgi:hypothetical protein